MSYVLDETSAGASRFEDEPPTTDAVDRIREALRGLRFGTVNVIVQDGVVVQVERTEKLRLRQRERER